MKFKETILNFDKNHYILQGYEDRLRYINPKTGKIYLTYWFKEKEIQVPSDLYEVIKENSEYISFINWFNKEFTQDAKFLIH